MSKAPPILENKTFVAVSVENALLVELDDIVFAIRLLEPKSTVAVAPI